MEKRCNVSLEWEPCLALSYSPMPMPPPFKLYLIGYTLELWESQVCQRERLEILGARLKCARDAKGAGLWR